MYKVWQRLLHGIDARSWPSWVNYDRPCPAGVSPASAVKSEPAPWARVGAAFLAELAAAQEAAALAELTAAQDAAALAELAAAQEAAALAELAAAQEAAERRRILVQRWVELPASEVPGVVLRVYCVLFGALLFFAQMPKFLMQWEINLVQWEISLMQGMFDEINLPGAAVLFCAPLWALLSLMQMLESVMLWQIGLMQDVLDAMHKQL